MKRFLALTLCIIMAFCLAACGEKGSTANPNKNGNTDYSKGTHHVVIDVKDYGKIELELDADTAPITVENFCTLAENGFYDGLTFHRIIDGFMVQGGDPDHNGTGGSDKEIKGEFAANGVRNDISHKRGVISMARATPYNSASSQFFICNADASRSLDYSYAAFGYVIAGLSVVDSITAATAGYGDSNGGIEDKSKQAVIKKVIEITEEEAMKYVEISKKG